MISTEYNNLQFALIENLAAFYRDSGASRPATRLRSMIDAIKVFFKLPATKIKVYVTPGDNIFKIEMYLPDTSKLPFGWFVYVPKNNQVDLYDALSPTIPVIQWKNKKAVTKNYSILYDRSNLDNLYRGIIMLS